MKLESQPAPHLDQRWAWAPSLPQTDAQDRQAALCPASALGRRESPYSSSGPLFQPRVSNRFLFKVQSVQESYSISLQPTLYFIQSEHGFMDSCRGVYSFKLVSLMNRIKPKEICHGLFFFNIFLFTFMYLLIYLFLAALGLRCCVRAFL